MGGLPDRDPWTETPLTEKLPPPPVDRQIPVKTLPSQTSFAGGSKLTFLYLEIILGFGSDF